MCGICGDISFTGRTDLAAIQSMSDAMRSRGPDSQGAIAHGHVSLGHARLSIIDVSPLSEQPMGDSDLGLSIPFNGCIYN